MMKGGNKQIVKYFIEKSGVRFVVGRIPPPWRICGAQNLTLRWIKNPRLSLGIGRRFYREFHTSTIFPAWAKVPIRYFGIFHDRVLVLRPHFRKIENFRRGKIYAFRPTRGS